MISNSIGTSFAAIRIAGRRPNGGAGGSGGGTDRQFGDDFQMVVILLLCPFVFAAMLGVVLVAFNALRTPPTAQERAARFQRDRADLARRIKLGPMGNRKGTP